MTKLCGVLLFFGFIILARSVLLLPRRSKNNVDKVGHEGKRGGVPVGKVGWEPMRVIFPYGLQIYDDDDHHEFSVMVFPGGGGAVLPLNFQPPANLSLAHFSYKFCRRVTIGCC